MENIAQYASWAYLIGAVLFILTLRGLSGPSTAIMGNRYGMLGMGLAVVATFFIAPNPHFGLILGAMVAGAAIGIYRARTVAMTHMPETVAMMHSLVGLAAVLIAMWRLCCISGESHSTLSRFELFVGCFIGAITFQRLRFCLRQIGGKKMGEIFARQLGKSGASYTGFGDAGLSGAHYFCDRKHDCLFG
jgi:NAD(P) transhydrogenase subunit beta